MGIPEQLGVRLHRVFIVVRTWSGAEARLGTYTDVETEITPRPSVTARNGGRELVIKGIIKEHTGGGYAVSQLHPSDNVNAEVFYRVEGPDSGHYTLVDFQASRPFTYRVVLRALDRRYPLPQGS